MAIYRSTLHLKTHVYLRDDGIRPQIELDETDHLLAKEQHGGISIERALELVHLVENARPTDDSL
ncbi:DUF2199 domain-containing protein [Stieleria neptunia]